MNEQSAKQIFAEAYNRTLGLLSRREHSVVELHRKLTSRGYEQEIQQQVIEQLHDRGLQDDSEFARSFVESRRGRGFGPLKIAAELHQRGIDRDTARDLLVDDGRWLVSCRQVAERKFGTSDGNVGDLDQLDSDDFDPDDPNRNSSQLNQRERLRRSRFLQQRGFLPAMIARVFRDQRDQIDG